MSVGLRRRRCAGHELTQVAAQDCRLVRLQTPVESLVAASVPACVAWTNSDSVTSSTYPHAQSIALETIERGEG